MILNIENGSKVERAMIAANGEKFTTILLRHRDPTISAATKKTYHAFLKKASRRSLPSLEGEQTNPIEADEVQLNGCWRLRGARDVFPWFGPRIFPTGSAVICSA